MVALSQDNYFLRGEAEAYGVTAVDVHLLLSLAHKAFDWQPIETAPMDGSTFLVWSPESAGGCNTYDFAEFDKRSGQFCKHGCGWDYAAQWAAIAMEAGTGETERLDPKGDSAAIAQKEAGHDH
jgi:hypothetical protein